MDRAAELNATTAQHAPATTRMDMRPHTTRFLLATLTAGACTLAVTGSATAAGTTSQDASLRIMLTNDDGWDHPGITAIYDGLVAAGHEVTMVAPLTNNTGAGAALTTGGSLVVTHPEPGKYAVDGTPADTAEFGFNRVFAGDAPDLVVSGTNRGQNVGTGTVHSGTAGAIVTSLNNGVPGIAISTAADLRGGHRDNLPYAATAAYLVTLLDQLQDARKAGDPLLPKGVGLNVNYPYLAGGTGTPAGVKLAKSGASFYDYTYVNAELPAVGDSASFTLALVSQPADPGSDDDLLDRGYITITPIAGNYDIETPQAVLGKLNAIFRR